MLKKADSNGSVLLAAKRGVQRRPGLQPNNRIHAPVRAVTARAKSARSAPARPARDAAR